METITHLLSGYRTYLVAFAAGGTVTIHLLGYIDLETAAKLLEILGVAAIVTLRAAIANVQKNL